MVKEEVNVWLNSFQNAINHFCENEFLQFTVTIWGKDREDNTVSEKVNVDKNEFFLFSIWNYDGTKINQFFGSI